MSSSKRILAATDFSPVAERAVQRAAHVARQQHAVLSLLHVVRPLDLYPGMTLDAEALGRHDAVLQETGESRLDDMAGQFASAFGIRVEAASRIGRPHQEIAEHAVATGAALVVVGARGENSLLDLLLGSTASRLVRLAAYPVLLVRKPADGPYRKVLAAVDFSPVSAEVVRQALALAGGAPMDVLHVLGSEVERHLRKAKLAGLDVKEWLDRRRAEAARQIDALLASIEGASAVGRRFLPGLASAAICQDIESNAVDLVVLGRHGYGGGLQDWMLGSVSKDVAFSTACDVLLINPANGT
jgi:nucleotide-binding universal stress UspA family protein